MDFLFKKEEYRIYLLKKEFLLNVTPKTLVMNFIIFFSVVSFANLAKNFFRSFIVETQMLLNSTVSSAVKRNVS